MSDTEWIAGTDWVDGDTLTEQRLDEQQGNADFLRDEARYRIAAQSAKTEDIHGSDIVNYNVARIRVTLGSNTYTTSWVENPGSWPTVWTTPMPRNQAVSGLSGGTKYDLSIYLDWGPSTGSTTAWQIGSAAVFNVEDIGYFSLFAKVTWQGVRTMRFNNLAIILTRDDEAL